jgi:hypothetical protein
MPGWAYRKDAIMNDLIVNARDGIEEVLEEVHQATRDARREIVRMEAYLQDCGIDVPIDTADYADEHPEISRAERLVYASFDGKFRLLVQTEVQSDAEDEYGFPTWTTVSRTPWLSCDRGIQMRTLPGLVVLIKLIPRVLNAWTDQVRTTVKRLEEVWPD